MSNNTINSYEIIQEIGKSTTSIIYKAYDKESNRQVRIKRLIPSESIKRDIVKIKSYVDISHPNLCSVHAVEKFEDTYIIISDFVDGYTLQEIILTKNYTRVEILNLLLQISKGLSQLHKNNLYHGNLKLSNIVIDEHNTVILVDAGLSPFDDFQNSPEFYAPYIATHYLSPEQIQNEPMSLQTDFFVLGIIAYRLLLGQLPFAGNNEEELLNSISHDNPDFSNIGEGPQSRLIELFLGKLLSKKKFYRFTNNSELIATLQEIINCDDSFEPIPDDAEKMTNPRKYLIVSVILLIFMVLWVVGAYIYK